MTRKLRRLHSVPTGADVDATRDPAAPQSHAPPAPPALQGLDSATGPASVPGWPFPLVDLSSLTPDDVAALMDRIGQFSRDGRFQSGQQSYRDLGERGELLDDPDASDVAEMNDDLTLLDIDRAAPPPATSAATPRNLPVGATVGLPAPLTVLLSRTTGPAGSTLADLLTHIDFAASISLSPTATEQLAHRYTWLLQRVGSTGIPLTAAGYLKPLDVSAAFTELDLGNEWIGTGNREVHSLPVLLLRESAQKLGLLRKSNGRLLRTKAGSSVAGEPGALLEWIASRLPLGRSLQEKDAGLALLTVICALGPQDGAGPARPTDQLVADVLSGLGWRDHDGQPISAMLANLTAEPTETVLVHLGALRRLPRSARGSITPEGAEFARLALTR